MRGFAAERRSITQRITKQMSAMHRLVFIPARFVSGRTRHRTTRGIAEYCRLGLIMLAAFVLPAPAIYAGPAYNVYTSAASTFGYGCGQTTSYSTAAGASYGSSTPQAGVTCNLGPASSTPSGPGGLSATSVASATLVSGIPPSGGCCDNDAVSSSATADLASGELHLYSSDANNYNGNGGGGVGPVAIAGLADTLNFFNADATSSTVWDFAATFSFDGTVTNPGNEAIGDGNGTYISLGGVTALWAVSPESGVNCPSAEIPGAYETLTCSYTDWVTTVTESITGPTATIPVGMGMWLDADGNDVADFSQTAAVSLSLPEDVSFTSASGVFLTAPVPEPSAGWLALIGLGFILSAKCLRARMLH
jgi:hypothetical protein